MKKIFLSLIIMLPAIGFSQATVLYKETFVTDNVSSGKYNEEKQIKSDLRGAETVFYNVGDKKVAGNPYFFDDAAVGDMITVSGTKFTGNKLKYNIFEQGVFFVENGKDYKVNEEIGEFFLSGIQKGVKIIRFINAEQITKPKKPAYYEVLLESSNGFVLKENNKVVAQLDAGFNTVDSKQYFKQTFDYWYYNKGTKKLSKIKLNASALSAATGIDKNKIELLNPGDIAFGDDQQLIIFFEKLVLL